MDNWNTKQKIIAQSICVLLSIGLWFYVTNSENPMLTNEVNRVPVEIVNADKLLDSKLVLSPNQEFYVSLKIEGLSQDLRRVNKSDFKIKVDLSGYALKKGEYKIPVNIVDWPSKINIKNGNGLTVNILIEDYVEKEVNVNSNILINASDNNYVDSPIFNPSKVMVSGPESLVSEVNSVIAEGQEDNVTETIVKNYSIHASDANGKVINGVNLSQDTVEATININQGKVVPIKVNTSGTLNTNVKLKSIVLSKDTIKINGPQNVLDTISEINTSNIDLSTIKDNSHIEVSLIIPDEIKIDSESNTITVNVSIDKIVSKDISVPYTIIGIQDGLKVTVSSETVNVRVSGFQEDLDRLTADDISAELDVAKHTQPGSFSESPKVALITFTDILKIDSVDKINYEIIKEETIPTQ